MSMGDKALRAGRVPCIKKVTVLDDGDAGGMVSVYLDFDFNAEQWEVNSPSIALIGERKSVPCAMQHPMTPPYKCEKCDPDGALQAAYDRQCNRRGNEGN